MLEAIWLVREDEYSVTAASKLITSVKKNEVPRMTLRDREAWRAPSLGQATEVELWGGGGACVPSSSIHWRESGRILCSHTVSPGGRMIGWDMIESAASRTVGMAGSRWKSLQTSSSLDEVKGFLEKCGSLVPGLANFWWQWWAQPDEMGLSPAFL